MTVASAPLFLEKLKPHKPHNISVIVLTSN